MADIDSAIVDARRRATSYTDVDGLLTLAQSAYALVVGLLFIWRPTNQIVASLVCLLMFIGWSFIGEPDGRVMLWLKTRITYPRTGFVAFPVTSSGSKTEIDKPRRILEWATWATFLGSVVFASYAGNIWLGLIAMSGGIAAVYLAHRDEVRFRFLWLLIPSLWLGGAIKAVLPTWRIDEVASMWFIYGILLFMVGVARLLRFLRLHRVPPA